MNASANAVKKIKSLSVLRDGSRPNLDEREWSVLATTRSGCGAKCVAAGVPCRGCYGLPSNIRDQGAKMASALASVIDSIDEAEVERILDTVADPL
jgi:F420-non-reducing hydrogenase small subunit